MNIAMTLNNQTAPQGSGERECVIMTTIEQVEKLREKTNVSYAQAKEALEKCNDDILDAILYLEEMGQIKTPENGGTYSSHEQSKDKSGKQGAKKNKNDVYYAEYDGKDSFQSLLGKFWGWCKKLLKKGCINNFEVYRYGRSIFKMPVIVFLFLLICAFWIAVPLLIVGLVFKFKYLFSGPDLSDMDIDKAIDAVADTAKTVKNEFKSAAESFEKKNKD